MLQYMHNGGALSSDDKERTHLPRSHQPSREASRCGIASLGAIGAYFRHGNFRVPCLGNAGKCIAAAVEPSPVECLGRHFPQMNRSDDTNHTSSGGDFKLDFHALTMANAIALFESDVTPVLSVLKSMILITGRGLHSPQGQSVLRQALCDHIEAQDNIIWDNVRRNSGAIRVRWQPRA
jgi:hypothetical protein